MEQTVQVYRQKPETIASGLSEELVVLDLANASYLGFNSTAAFLWRLLGEPQTVDRLCAAAIREFEVDEVRCRAEIDSLLAGLISANLVEVSNAA